MQAFIITAYKDEQQLLRLVSMVNRIGKVYVHIDKKSTELNVDKLKNLNIPNTIFMSKYRIYWGSFNHVKAIFYLLNVALMDSKIHYVHILSGQDYPVRQAEEFENYFDTECTAIHMSCSDETQYGIGVVDRYSYWYPMTKQNPNSIVVRGLNRAFVSMQKRLSIKKKTIGKYDKIYKGMIYVSAPRNAMEYVKDCFSKDRRLHRNLSHVRLAEEFIFQTVLMNSDYISDIDNNGLRYNDWEHAEGGSPAIINESHYDRIKEGNYYFARKFSTGESDKLIELLQLNS